jgi:membrane-associated phospholipid phosphatase
MLGITYFQDMYQRGSAVFGALPSLHASYPLYGLLVTFRRASLPSTLLQVGYALLMAFAAVYLEHHYVIDVLLGILYTLVAFGLIRRLFPPGEAAAREREAGSG